MNSTNQPTKYGKEVIGKKVLIRFVVEDGKYAWFQGSVKEQKDDEHRIAFDYGEEDEWGNLKEWENDKELQWVRDIEKEEMKDAIGRCVLVEFPIQKKRKAWFQAKVGRMRKNMTKKGKEIVEHLVVYDDEGGEEWLDLWECVKGGKLQFLGNNRVPVVNLAERVATKDADEVNSKRKNNSNPIISTSPAPDQRKPKKIKEDEEAKLPADWTNEMEQWLMQTREGQDESNHRIMEQVRKLASGKGLRCPGWDTDRYAFLGTKVNLRCHLPRLLEHAQSLREEFGMDGELDLIVPLEQMMRYKKSLLDSVDWNA